jgi:anti-sigma factor RsiW
MSSGGEWDGQLHFGASPRRRADRELGSDQHCPLAHARIPCEDEASSGSMPRPSSRTVSTAEIPSRQTQVGSLRLGVPRDVRERLLGDPVDHELLLLGQWQVRVEAPDDADLSPFPDPARKRRERALESQILEGLWA